jgi:hypothetical protein
MRFSNFCYHVALQNQELAQQKWEVHTVVRNLDIGYSDGFLPPTLEVKTYQF